MKNQPANAGDIRFRFYPWAGKIPWRRAWQPTPVFLPRESHGQSSLVGRVHRVTKSRTRLKQLSMHAQRASKWQRRTLWSVLSYSRISAFNLCATCSMSMVCHHLKRNCYTSVFLCIPGGKTSQIITTHALFLCWGTGCLFFFFFLKPFWH